MTASKQTTAAGATWRGHSRISAPTVLLIVLCLTVGCGSVIGGGKPYVIPHHAADASTSIGSIEWVIREGWDGPVVSQGRREIQLKDVRVVNAEAGTGLLTAFALDDKFKMDFTGSHEGLAAGIGFAASRQGHNDDSWEWFKIDRPDQASKEGQFLRLKLRDEGSNTEIAETEFLTDVTVPFEPIERGSDGKSEWVLTIRKGSLLRWPAVSNGHVVVAPPTR